MYEQKNKMCFLHNRLHDKNTAVQRQKAVTAYFTSKQLLSFGFAEQCRAEQIMYKINMAKPCHCSQMYIKYILRVIWQFK